jgi:hypothetical protein
MSNALASVQAFVTELGWPTIFLMAAAAALGVALHYTKPGRK